MELSKERLERLRELLAPAHQQIVIVSHTNPDGDAVGSSLAWAEVLRTMGHEVTCVVPNKFPYFLDWMPGIDEIVVFKTDTEGRAARAIAEADILFCLDFIRPLMPFQFINYRSFFSHEITSIFSLDIISYFTLIFAK